MTTYPETVQSLIQTVAELLSLRDNRELAELLRSSDASLDWLEHDNWDGGTEYYFLRLRVPVAIFASIEARREGVEKLLLQKFKTASRQFDGHIITRVVITPDGQAHAGPNPLRATSETIERTWGTQHFRLFLSHRAQDKVLARQLKEHLLSYGVGAFVAHEDIEPGRESVAEMEWALASMHCMTALITPEFHQSVWCQQEIGFALGRGIPVISMGLGGDPEGFISKIQAVRADSGDVAALVSKMVDHLLKHPRTAGFMCEATLQAFEVVQSWEHARQLSPLIEGITTFDKEQLRRLELASTNNEKIVTAWGVPEAIKRVLARDVGKVPG